MDIAKHLRDLAKAMRPSGLGGSGCALSWSENKYLDQDADEIERLRAALRMGLQLGESGKHGDGPSCPTCHFVREARKALGVEQSEGK